MSKLRGILARPDLKNSLSAVVGSAIGFIFPFLASAKLQSDDSDALLLALSVPILLTSLIGSAIEINTVAELGKRQIDSFGRLSSGIWRRYNLKVLAFSFLVTVVVVPVLTCVYLSSFSSSSFLVPLLAVALCPIATAWSSVASGEAIYSGYTSKAILMQSFKAIPPIFILVLGGPIVWVALGFLAGELIRGAYLRRLNAGNRRDPAGAPNLDAPRSQRSEMNISSIPWQTMSSGVAQAGPVAGRAFISSGPVGGVSAYEIADKILFAAAQFLNLGLLLRRIAQWSRFPTMESTHARSEFSRDVRVLVIACIALSVVGATACLVLRQLSIVPDAWDLGLLWGAFQCCGLLPQIVSVAASRLLIIGGSSRSLLPLAIVNVVVTIGLFASLYTAFGPVGIIYGTVISRWVLVLFYWLAVHRTRFTIFGGQTDNSRNTVKASRSE